MKVCIYCGGDIADLARKCHHCHSFQNPADAPRAGFDTANLVISFVGSIAGIATVAAAIFAYFGFKTVDDINKRANEINTRADTTLATANNKLSEFEKQISALTAQGQATNKKSEETQGRLNALFVSTQYVRFQELFDGVILDRIDARPDLVSELTGITKSVVDLADLPDDKKIMQMELITTVKSIERYKMGDYRGVVEILTPLPDAGINKHRILGNAYSKLRLQAKNARRDDDAKTYSEHEVRHQKLYTDRATRANKKTRIAATNLGIALIERNLPGDLESGCKSLAQAQDEAPEVWITHFNLAICHVIKEEYERALGLLERAKGLGAFSSGEEVAKFRASPYFARLIGHQGPEIRARVEQLLKL
jgi:hypothetical protein